MGASIAVNAARGGRYQPSAEINVVPFVDVMLVLLIIFMVAAPMATTSLRIDVPPAMAGGVPDPNDPIFVSLSRDGTAYVGKSVGDFASLSVRAWTLADGAFDRRVMIRADAEVPYGAMVDAMESLRNVGFDRLTVIAEEL